MKRTKAVLSEEQLVASAVRYIDAHLRDVNRLLIIFDQRFMKKGRIYVERYIDERKLSIPSGEHKLANISEPIRNQHGEHLELWLEVYHDKEKIGELIICFTNNKPVGMKAAKRIAVAA